mmetsp:Transcript_13089/g.33191  ORF Transcript_13089/g.33191 Transcript_13089/m.33191 type:complete len:84 (+) Transcript_13089:332-583(+)
MRPARTVNRVRWQVVKRVRGLAALRQVRPWAGLGIRQRTVERWEQKAAARGPGQAAVGEPRIAAVQMSQLVAFVSQLAESGWT